MQPDAIMLTVIAAFMFGILVGYILGRPAAAKPTAPYKEPGHDADYWKRGEEPPDWTS